jgi:SAM-dependent methyltransferase
MTNLDIKCKVTPPPGGVIRDIPIGEAMNTVDDAVREVIFKALKIKTRSYSSLERIETGNAYQAVRLRDDVIPGFRASDDNAWAGIGVIGQSVLDLGCNLGERARLAVREGAAFVEGVEYEELFVLIGGLINVYNRMTNVWLRQGDLTQAGCIQKECDIVACFSAFVYVKTNLTEILSKCRQLFVLETHALDAGWFNQYIVPVANEMPYWVIYGFADHGAKLAEKRRATIAFGRDVERIRNIPDERARLLGLGQRNVGCISVGNSPLASGLCGEHRDTRAVFARFRENQRTTSFSSVVDLLPALKQLVIDLEACRRPTYDDNFPSDYYWAMLLRGIIDYAEQGQLTSDNAYIEYLRKLTSENKYDPGMRDLLTTDGDAITRLKFRLDSILSIMQIKEVSGPPIIIYNALSTDALATRGIHENCYDAKDFVVDGKNRRYLAPIIDGYHRFAALYLSGADEVNCLFVWSNIYSINQSGLGAAAAGHVKGWKDDGIGWLVEASVAQIFETDEILHNGGPKLRTNEAATCKVR